MTKNIDAASLGVDPGAMEEILRQEPRSHRARQRITETFARIPHDRARKLFQHIGGPAWLLLTEIDRLILKGKGRNPVKLTGDALQGSGLSRWEKERALRLLERAGIITIKRKRGRCPLVTYLWYPIKN